MKSLLIALSLTSLGCAAPKPKAQTFDDDVLEKGVLEKMRPKEGLTKTFSYRQLRWDSNEVLVLRRLGRPTSEFKKGTLALLTFASTTRGIKTRTTSGLVDDKLVTLDISIHSSEKCSDALPKWTDALRLKYGPITKTTDLYTLWKIADGSIIVIEKAEKDCAIVYAKNASARQSVTALFK